MAIAKIGESMRTTERPWSAPASVDGDEPSPRKRRRLNATQ
jgi:hypothetical protein